MQLDFLQKRPPTPLIAWIMLFVGGLTFVYAAERYQALMQAEQSHERRAAALQQSLAKNSSLRQTQLRHKENTLLAADWNLLLKKLEATRSDDVAILSLEVNAKTGQVTIQAESPDEESMVNYLEQLKYEPLLANATLANHEVQEDSAANAVKYLIRMKWATP